MEANELTTISIKLFKVLILMSHKDMKDKIHYLEEHMKCILTFLRFNHSQISYVIYLMDQIMNRKQKSYVHSLENLKNVFDLAAVICHKITDDWAYIQKDLEVIFENPQLTRLENSYFKEIDFDLKIDYDLLNQYHELLIRE